MAYPKGIRSVEKPQGWDTCNRDFSDYFKQKAICYLKIYSYEIPFKNDEV